ncbi:MAG: MFS transporter [Dehalococcoidia bacterium]|nr:MFS transporter [Dehalococcoidia bacterium]
MTRSYYYGYRIVAACFIIQIAGGGAFATYGLFFSDLQSEFGWSRAAISGASSLATLLMGAASILCGRLNDRIGPRIVMVVSGLALGGGYLLMSRLGAVWHLYVAYGLLVGIGMSTQDVVTLSTIARWFIARRGMMSGIVKVGTGVGQLLVPLAAATLIAIYGWRGAYVAIGLFVLLMLLVGARFLRRDPQSAGLRPFTGRESDAVPVPGGEVGLTLAAGVRTRQFWLVCLSEFTMSFCIMTTLVHLVNHARDLGVAPAAAGALLSVIGASSIAARFLLGSASDVIGCRKAFSICFGMLFVGLLWLQTAASLWMLVIYAIADGFARGGNFVVISPLMAELFGTRAHGALFGLATFIGTIGGAVGPLLAGRIFDVTSSYSTAFILLSVLMGVGLAATLLLRPLVTGRTDPASS